MIFTMIVVIVRISALLCILVSNSNAFIRHYSHPTGLFGVLLQSQQPSDWLRNPTDTSEAANVVENAFRRGQQRQPQQQEGPVLPEEFHIPTTGISVSDVMEEESQTQFETVLVPIEGLEGVAQIVTTSTGGGLEPVRYLINVTDPSSTSSCSFVMTDVPPYSELLAAKLRRYMGPLGTLDAILLTSKDAIHYNQAPAVFTTRRSDLFQWKSVFEDVHVVGYRLDIPRDCAELVTQRLDGYGPWALDKSGTTIKNMTFEETGRPLTREEWDEDTTKGIIDKKETPPDEEMTEENEAYSPEGIRARQEGKTVLAVYTPGHTFGTISYLFPNLEAVVSGYTIPIEDDRDQDSPGPALDYRGYITTSKAGIQLQMESARHLVEMYSDRFKVVLPSRADPLFLGGNSFEARREILLRIVSEYEKVGKVYEQLGILSDNEDGDDDE